eukprot:TRINITY_DN2571_c1_g1_i3.p1 TRINITY_DN2571_c1_g1~~TRINITY_DN2571_c1_g1_i3.p1  ORF type:complete len:652 (-),score=57.74 TRINITY_DN2571_c1_g1_i3:3174-5072(-)
MDTQPETQALLEPSQSEPEIVPIEENESEYEEKPTKTEKRGRYYWCLSAALVATVCLVLGVVAAIFISLQNGSDTVNRKSQSSSYDNLRLEQKSNRPIFHVMPAKGWLNDPNGLYYRDGVYHTFYQYNPVNNSWDWGISWGHAVSTDLIHWTNLKPAIKPSRNGADCNGCWSGCMTTNEDGQPMIVYTGTTRDNSECYIPQAQQNWDYNDKIGFRETIMYALPNLWVNSPNLDSWGKRDILIQGPPQGDLLQGWRDPFVYQRGVDGKEWVLLVGTGRMTPEEPNMGGGIMVYSSSSFFEKWQMRGFMFQGSPEEGLMWECPWMVEITPQVGKSESTHILGVGASIWEYSHPGVLDNPVLYYMGKFNESTWKFEKTSGPHFLDIGQTFYAANRMIDDNGRVLIWGWLRECMVYNRQPVCDQQDYAGSLGIPRQVFVDGDYMKQRPPEEIKELRRERFWSSNSTQEEVDKFLQIFDGLHDHFECEITLQRMDARASGLLLSRAGPSMLLVYVWETQQLKAIKGTLDQLQMVDPINFDGSLANYEGHLQDMEDRDVLGLRVFVDGSAVEVFTSSGQVMSLRLYHGVEIRPQQGVQVASFFGSTRIVEGNAWTMNSIWDHNLHSENFARALRSFTH